MRFLNKKSAFKILLIIILFIIYFFISAISYANTISSSLSSNVFRLHIVANSDSKEDQTLKLLVRDALLEYMDSLCLDCKTKEEAMNIAKEHVLDFSIIAKRVVKKNGYDYDVSVSVEQCFFPTKTYGDISLPEGLYDSLNVKIGDSVGHNWWCVMFPPLCFVDISSGVVPEDSKDILKDNLSEDEYDLITADASSSPSFKFKLVELVEKFKSQL